MIRVIALTQFAFLALGIVALKIMIHAKTTPASSSVQSLNDVALWLFAVPLIWVAFASLCAHVEKLPLTSKVARLVGTILAVACFAFLASVTFLS